MGLNVALLRAIEGRFWRLHAFTLQRPTRSQTDTGGWIDTWATVATGLCRLQNDSGQTVVGPDGEASTVVVSLCYLPPTLAVSPQDQLIIGGITYQIGTLRNPDDPQRASLIVEVERLAT